ncbi:MAG TPA: tetratricopeptide repeat protein [Firmicutes bacterium]|nr:tetratricopeptide repeat protein [Bacillota bacterium]
MYLARTPLGRAAILPVAIVALAVIFTTAAFARGGASPDHLALARQYAIQAGVPASIDYRLGLWSEPGFVARYRLTRAYPKDQGALDMCRKEYSRALSENPSDIEAMMGSGWAAFSAGDYPAAYDIFMKALDTLDSMKPGRKSEPTSENAQGGGAVSRGDLAAAIGAVCFSDGKAGVAGRWFAEALQDPAISEDGKSLAQYGLGMVSLWGQEADKAAGYLREAQEASGDKRYIKSAMAKVRVCQGRFQDAVRIYSEILESDPRDALAHDNLAGLLMSPWPDQAGQKPDLNAEEHLQAAVQEEPGLIRACLSLAKLYFDTKQPQKAAEILDRAAKAAAPPESSIIEWLRDLSGQAGPAVRAIIPVPYPGAPAGSGGVAGQGVSVTISHGMQYTRDDVVPLAISGMDLRRMVGLWISDQIRRYWHSLYWPVVWVRLPGGDGPKRLNLTLMDISGKTIHTAAQTILDANPPRGKVTIISDDQPSSESRFTRSRTVTLELWAHDDGSEVEAVSLAEDGMPWGPWERYSFRRPFTIFGPEGEVWVYARFRDRSGNISQAFGDSIILDTTPPEITAVFPPTVRERSALVTWFTDEESDSLVEYGTRHREYSREARDGKFTTWHTVMLDGLEPGTTYYCRIRSRDRARNSSEYHEFRFTTAGRRDTTPPKGGIKINGGASHTRTTQVGLDLWAQDDETGVQDMCFSEDGTRFTSWVRFQEQSRYTLRSGDGKKTVYVKFRDKAGNESRPYSATIILDTRQPSFAEVNAVDVSEKDATIAWNTDEPCYGAVYYRNGNDSRIVKDDRLDARHRTKLTGLSPGTTYQYQVKAHDAAGNEVTSPVKTFKTRGGSSAPTPPAPPGPPPGGGVKPGTNVASMASGARAVVSSEYKDPSSGKVYAASFAIDQNPSTGWSPLPGLAGTLRPQWIEVHFNTEYLIDSIRVSLVEGMAPDTFSVAYRSGSGDWMRIGSAGDAGRRVSSGVPGVVAYEFRFNPLKASAIKILLPARLPSEITRVVEIEARAAGGQ